MSTRLCIASLLAAIVLIYVGTRKARNHRRRDVLGAPSEACRRGSVESVP